MAMEYLRQLEDIFADQPIEAALRQTAQLFPGRVKFSSSLGQEDQVLTDIIARHQIPINIFTIDTGRLFNEAYETLERTTARYKIPVDVFFPQAEAVQEMVGEKGVNLFYESVANRQLCCHVRKVDASLYFGSGDYENTLTYLNKIINWKVDLRNDLQCYARLLHLIAHYELGNYDLIEYLLKSVYRFMAKMDNLGAVEEEVFKFLQRSFHLTPAELKPEFEKLLEKLRQYEHNRFETRAFAYLDIISWLESKISNQHVQDVIRKKTLEHKRFLSANQPAG